MPIDAAGRFSYRPADDPGTSCIPRSGGLVAECTIGKGRALIVADAALFDGHDPTPEREQALGWLIASAFAPPVVAAFAARSGLTLMFLAFALMVLWKHRGNLERLLAGTEPRIGAA